MSAISKIPVDSQDARVETRRDSASPSRLCPQCNQPLAPKAVDGMCPKCLMGMVMTDTLGALEDITDSPSDAGIMGGLPNQFGRYTILGQLGRGAMGVVHLAKDDELDRMVAIKVPLFGRFNEEAVYRRFQREVRAAAGLRHPNICPIYDVGQIDGTIFMSMAYIAGRPLTEFIASDKEFPIRQLALLVRKLATAMQEAHRHGIVHRDLKPANIMVDQRGEPMVMDFGLASRNSSDDPRVTCSGVIVGTPAYMAPEQLAGQAAGPAGDIYALGVVLYELLAGQLPFQGDLVELVAQIARDEPRRPSALRADVPDQLNEICFRALAKRTEDRYASMGDLAQALTQFLADLTTAESTTCTAATADSAALPAKNRAPGPAPTNDWWQHVVAGLGGLLLAGCGVLVVCLLAGVQTTRPQAIAGVTSSTRPTARQGPAETPPVAPLSPPAAEASSSYGLGAAVAERTPLESDAAFEFPGRAAAPGSGSSVSSGSDIERSSSQEKTVGVDPARNSATDARGDELDPRDSRSSPFASPALGVTVAGTQEPTVDNGSNTSDPPSASPTTTAALAKESPATLGTPAGRSSRTTTDPAKRHDDAGNTLFHQALDELRDIAFDRRQLIEKMGQTILRHNVELPDAYVKEMAKLAGLKREAGVLQDEAQEVDDSIHEIRIDNLRFDLSYRDRLLNGENLKGLQRLQARQIIKLKAYAVEIHGQELRVEEIEKARATAKAEHAQQVIEATKLLERAFWATEPTGSFSAEQYVQISDLIADRLKDRTASVEIRALHAIAMVNAGKLEAARLEASQAAPSNSQSALAVAALGYVKLKSDQANEGLRDLTRAIKMSDRFAAAYVLRGLVNRQLERHDAALSDFLRAKSLEADNVYVVRLLAMQYAASPIDHQRDPLKAIALAKQVCQRTDSKDWQSLDALAAAQASMGEFGQAATMQEEAIKLCPDRALDDALARLTMYQENRAFRLK